MEITTKIRWASATRAFFRPNRWDCRAYCFWNRVPLERLAAQATCTSVVRSHWLPLVVLALRRFGPLWSLPGLIPAQEQRWPELGNGLMSALISARITSAAVALIPGIGISRRRAVANGSWASAGSARAG